MYEDAINYNKDKNGNIWSIDKFDWQINNFYHEERMNELGFDYDDRWDSLEYGFILFEESGTKFWSASRGCWQK